MTYAARHHANELVIVELGQLMLLDQQATQVYVIAVQRLHDPSCRARLASFLADHERHIQVLAALLREYGGTTARTSANAPTLPRDIQEMHNIVGDQEILKAMNCNERTTRDTYEQALGKLATKPDVVRVLKEHLADERRHQDWMERALQAT